MDKHIHILAIKISPVR